MVGCSGDQAARARTVTKRLFACRPGHPALGSSGLRWSVVSRRSSVLVGLMRKLSMKLLGQFEVLLDGEPVDSFAYNKLRALLAYLAVESARPLARAHLAALLWPDVPERLARQNLSQALRMLRGTLGEREPSVDGAAVPFLLVTSDAIRLNPLADCTVDATCFAALLAMVEAHQHRAIHLCDLCVERQRQAVALYHGDLLAQLPPHR